MRVTFRPAGSCLVCDRRDVRQINDAMLSGASRRSVARGFGITQSVLERHFHRCLPDDVAEAIAAGQEGSIDAFDGFALIERMAEVARVAMQQVKLIEDDMASGAPSIDPKSAAAVLSAATRSLAEVGKLAFAVQDRPRRAVADEVPEIDRAIWAALERRGHVVPADRPKAWQDEPVWAAPELEAGPS